MNVNTTEETRARYEATMNQPVSGRIGSRRRRRWSVVALYGSYVLICASAAITANLTTRPAYAVALALLLAGVAAAGYGVFTLMGRTFVNAPNIRDAALDERQRARRNDALARAYPVIGIFMALCLAYMMICDDVWPRLRNFTVIEALFWAAFLLAISLPSAIIAWTEPDPLPELEG
jgi:MFS family permease